MISKIVQTVNFKKLKKDIKPTLEDLSQQLLIGDPASVLKQRISKNVNYNNQPMRQLANSTRKIRKMRGNPTAKPLIDSGKLLNSLKTIKKKDKIGVRFMKYGMHQAEGFVTKNHFAVKNKKGKVVGWRDYSSGVRSLPRPWIHPEEPFAGLIKQDAEIRKTVIKEIKKAMKGKVVHRYNK